MGKNPSFFQPNGDGEKDLKTALDYREPYRRLSNLRTDFHPVEQVTWLDAVEFCRRLSKRESRVYRLPTEAEWEYACRAGSDGDVFWEYGDCREYCFGGGESTGPVGRLMPNEYGLYDTSGNVRELCSDLYSGGYYRVSNSVDPQGPTNDSHLRVVRGGSFACKLFNYSNPPSCGLKSWERAYAPENRATNNIGFRVVLEFSDEELARFRGTHDEKAILSRIPDLMPFVERKIVTRWR